MAIIFPSFPHFRYVGHKRKVDKIPSSHSAFGGISTGSTYTDVEVTEYVDHWGVSETRRMHQQMSKQTSCRILHFY